MVSEFGGGWSHDAGAATTPLTYRRRRHRLCRRRRPRRERRRPAVVPPRIFSSDRTTATNETTRKPFSEEATVRLPRRSPLCTRFVREVSRTPVDSTVREVPPIRGWSTREEQQCLISNPAVRQCRLGVRILIISERSLGLGVSVDNERISSDAGTSISGRTARGVVGSGSLDIAGRGVGGKAWRRGDRCLVGFDVDGFAGVEEQRVSKKECQEVARSRWKSAFGGQCQWPSPTGYTSRWVFREVSGVVVRGARAACQLLSRRMKKKYKNNCPWARAEHAQPADPREPGHSIQGSARSSVRSRTAVNQLDFVVSWKRDRRITHHVPFPSRDPEPRPSLSQHASAELHPSSSPCSPFSLLSLERPWYTGFRVCSRFATPRPRNRCRCWWYRSVRRRCTVIELPCADRRDAQHEPGTSAGQPKHARGNVCTMRLTETSAVRPSGCREVWLRADEVEASPGFPRSIRRREGAVVRPEIAATAAWTRRFLGTRRKFRILATRRPLGLLKILESEEVEGGKWTSVSARVSEEGAALGRRKSSCRNKETVSNRWRFPDSC